MKEQIGCSGGVMVKAVDVWFVVSEWEIQSRYYVPISDKYN